jgi:bile acid:Na+ symporter, BASS family
VILPLVAVALVIAFELRPAVKIALVALSVSPVPPLLPRKALKAGGKESYTVGLLSAMAVLSIITVPLGLELLERIFDVPLAMPPGKVAGVVLLTVLLPLSVGIALRAALPSVAARLAEHVLLAGMVILLAGAVPVLFAARHAIFSLIGDGTLAAFSAWTVVAVVVGHVLGGPERENRPVLALATASRHPAVAIGIAQVNFPEQRLAVAAVLLFMVVNGIVTGVYLAWLKHHRAHSRSSIEPAVKSQGAPSSRPA